LQAQGEKKKERLFSGDPEDWLTKNENEEALEKYEAKILGKVKKLVAASKYPDAHELINKYGKELPPSVTNALTQSGDLEAAIDAIKMTSSYIKDHAKDHINVAKAAENASRAKSTLGAGSSGAVSKASRYQSMSAEERLRLQDKFIRGYDE